MPRKPGKRNEDLSTDSSVKHLKIAKQFIRTDFGGSKDPLKVIHDKMASKGIEAGPKSCQAIKDYLEEQVNACRLRQFHRIDEVIRRLEAQEKAGKPPDPEDMP